MHKILVVEDSPIVLKILKRVVSDYSNFEPQYAQSLAEAKSLVEASEDSFFAALVDLNLPDAPDGEVVDYCLGLGLPTVVLTGSFDPEKRAQLQRKGVVDYVTKESRYSYEYAMGVMVRLVKNQSLKVLVVDDSETARNFVSSLLRLHLYQVFEAEDGIHAVKTLLNQPDMSMLITDFNMPRMDGCELVKHIRAKYEKSDLVIIGLSSDADQHLSARFIKAGANDFLRKPFNHEEFFCRVNQNIEVLELIASLRDHARRDPLSGNYNFQYFKECSQQWLTEHQGGESQASLAVLTLEGFDEILQSYGLEAAEMTLRSSGKVLAELFARFILARMDNQKFAVWLPGLSCDKAQAYLDSVRQAFSASAIESGQGATYLSFSAGVSAASHASLEECLGRAEQCLLVALDTGGDCVQGDES